jgi:hypothetical protein
MRTALAVDVRRALHSDAVVLNRQQLWFVLPAAGLVALAIWSQFVVGVDRRAATTLWESGLVLAWAAKIVMEWRRLKRVNPDEYE